METRTLAEWRNARNLSQAALAALIGFHKSLICFVERGKVVPSAKFLLACCQALQVARNQIVFESAKPRVRLPRNRLWLPRAFRSKPVRVAPALRQVFALALYTERGKALVHALDSQSYSGALFCAVKTMGGYMNGAEQKLFLHLLLDRGTVREVRPDEVAMPFAVVYPPLQWWLALVRDGCVYFSQLTVSVKGCQPRLDFLIAVPTTPPLHINLEADGPWHKGRQRQDAERARALGIPTLRVPVERLEAEDFVDWFDRELAALIRRERGSWRPHGSW